MENETDGNKKGGFDLLIERNELFFNQLQLIKYLKEFLSL